MGLHHWVFFHPQKILLWLLFDIKKNKTCFDEHHIGMLNCNTFCLLRSILKYLIKKKTLAVKITRSNCLQLCCFQWTPCFTGLMWAPSFSDFKYSNGLLRNAPEDATDGMISGWLATANDRHRRSMVTMPFLESHRPLHLGGSFGNYFKIEAQAWESSFWEHARGTFCTEPTADNLKTRKGKRGSLVAWSVVQLTKSRKAKNNPNLPSQT